MIATEGTAGIVGAIRKAVTQARSTSINLIAALPFFDAALLAAIVVGVLGLVSGEKP